MQTEFTAESFRLRSVSVTPISFMFASSAFDTGLDSAAGLLIALQLLSPSGSPAPSVSTPVLLILCSAHQSSLCFPLLPNIENQNLGEEKKEGTLSPRMGPQLGTKPDCGFVFSLLLFCDLGNLNLERRRKQTAGGCAASSDVLFSDPTDTESHGCPA